jgi:DNA polymerase-1
VKRLLLVDGHSVIYRSFFAFVRSPLRNSKGFNTSAVYGFAQMLQKLLAELKPDFCAVVYDAPGKTFRHEKFDQYKIQRPPAPEELPPQIPVIKGLVKAWGISGLEVPGVEADDVLGTLARKHAAAGLEVTIVTSDKDILQLVGDHVSAYDPWKEKRYRADEVKEKLGVGPEQVPELLALSGDSSDNIPGVPGIGPKRALEVLGRWGTLDAAIEHDDRVKPHAEIARLSRDLATIRTDVGVDAELEQLRVRDMDSERLRAIFREMSFKELTDSLPPEPGESVAVADFAGLDAVRRAGRFALQFQPDAGLWLSIDSAHTTLLPLSQAQAIKELLADPGLVKVGHNLKTQLKELNRAGLAVAPPLFDVGVGAWLVDPNRKGFELEDVVSQVLERTVVKPSADARPPLALKVYEVLRPQVAALGLDRVAAELEMPLVPILAAMEERGVKVDLAQLAQLEAELSVELAGIEQDIGRLAGRKLNLNSPKQLGELLFDQLKLPHGRKTKTGYSTGIEVLTELADKHEVVRRILRHRELTKLCGTYLGPLRESADPATHRVHAALNQTGTATGRLSSSNPNLQNIPVRTDLGRRIRRAFIAEDGSRLVSADYSQVELRVLAHISGDEELAEAFRRGDDVHTWTAAAILRIDPSRVKPEDRRLAKVVNYGLVYGMGDHGLSSRTDISIEQARDFLDAYMTRFAGVARWCEAIVERARQDGLVRTISGRIRPTPGILDRNRNVSEAAKRAAMNAPIQGSAADIVKRAMVALEDKLTAAGLGPGMVLQIHDELLFEVRADAARRACDLIRAEMENAWQLSVPLTVEVGTGLNWGEIH